MKEVMDPIEIVLCTDHRYIMPAGVMMYSVCKNNMDHPVRFHVLVDKSVTEEDRADLRDVAGMNAIQFYKVDARAFNSLPMLPNNSYATYYRLLIPQILPENIHKVLFLDCDIIVRHSILPLWETDIDGYALAAVIDNLDSSIGTFNRLRYSSILGYFNAGVLLLNLKYWRDNDIQSEIRLYVKNHSDSILFCDQDILNFVLRERKRPLPIKYNFQTCFLFSIDKCGFDYWKYEKEILEARKDPVILHYIFRKPWMEGCNHPFRSTFLRYQNETKWKSCIWKTPSLVTVRSHIRNILVEMGLFKSRFRSTKAKIFADGLRPID